MVIDSSAIIAILFNEPDAVSLRQGLTDDSIRLLSAGTVIEVTMIIEDRLGEIGGREFDLWLHRAGIEIVPVDAEQAETARRATNLYCLRVMIFREPMFSHAFKPQYASSSPTSTPTRLKANLGLWRPALCHARDYSGGP